METHGKVVRVGKRYALDTGAGGPSLDAAMPKELASGLVESVVVAVDVAQVDPGADDVAELHAALLEQALRRAEHVPSLFERVATGAVDVRRVQRCLGLRPPSFLRNRSPPSTGL